jgi:hypothetical protein
MGGAEARCAVTLRSRHRFCMRSGAALLAPRCKLHPWASPHPSSPRRASLPMSRAARAHPPREDLGRGRLEADPAQPDLGRRGGVWRRLGGGRTRTCTVWRSLSLISGAASAVAQWPACILHSPAESVAAATAGTFQVASPKELNLLSTRHYLKRYLVSRLASRISRLPLNAHAACKHAVCKSPLAHMHTPLHMDEDHCSCYGRLPLEPSRLMGCPCMGVHLHGRAPDQHHARQAPRQLAQPLPTCQLASL